MKIKAVQKNVRQAPRKMRLVANQLKQADLETTLRQLAVVERRSSLVILKVIKQAIANAMNNHQLPFESLELDEVLVTPGSIYKRWRAVSRGRAHEIKKRSCHVRVVLKTKSTAPQKNQQQQSAQKIKSKTQTQKKVTSKTKVKKAKK